MIHDIIFEIFAHLDLQDRYTYAQASQQHYEIFGYEILWKQYLEQLASDMTIKTLWNNNYKLTFKRYHQIKILQSQLNLPGAIDELFNLTSLKLCYKNLPTVPKQIGDLINLKLLDLQDNQFTEIPKELGNLISLEWLNVGNNQLTVLPTELGKLTKLKVLYAYQNPPIHIPDEITQIPKLKIKYLLLVS